MRRACLAGVAVVLVVLSLGACSHQSEKQKFVSAATKVCDESAHNIYVASVQVRSSATTTQQMSFFLGNTLVPLYRTRIDELRKLPPPSADKDTVTALLDDEAKVVDSIAASPDTFADARDDPFAAVDARWDQYGIQACGTRANSPVES